MTMHRRLIAQETFADKNPVWSAIAMRVINRWGREEATLQHAIGEALVEAFTAGERGVIPDAPENPHRLRPSDMVRLSRRGPRGLTPPTSAQSTSRVIRRQTK